MKNIIIVILFVFLVSCDFMNNGGDSLDYVGTWIRSEEVETDSGKYTEWIQITFEKSYYTGIASIHENMEMENVWTGARGPINVDSNFITYMPNEKWNYDAQVWEDYDGSQGTAEYSVSGNTLRMTGDGFTHEYEKK